MATKYKEFVDEYEKQSMGKAHPSAMGVAAKKAESTQFKLTDPEKREYEKYFGKKGMAATDAKKIKMLSEAKKAKLRKMMAKSVAKKSQSTSELLGDYAQQTGMPKGLKETTGLTDEEKRRFGMK